MSERKEAVAAAKEISIVYNLDVTADTFRCKQDGLLGQGWMELITQKERIEDIQDYLRTYEEDGDFEMQTKGEEDLAKQMLLGRQLIAKHRPS